MAPCTDSSVFSTPSKLPRWPMAMGAWSTGGAAKTPAINEIPKKTAAAVSSFLCFWKKGAFAEGFPNTLEPVGHLMPYAAHGVPGAVQLF